MLTWKLWRAINRSPLRSPIYLRALTGYQARANVQMPVRFLLAGWVRTVMLVILPLILIMLGPPLLFLLYYMALLLAPPLLPIANTLYGLAHVVSAGGRIAGERERRTYDLLCTTPPGMPGLHWSYCMGWIHHHVLYRNVMLGVLSIGIMASAFGLSPRVVFGVEPVALEVGAIRAVALTVIFVIDYAQSVVISSLTILLLPTDTEGTTNARVWLSSLFLALQLGVYLPTLLLGVYALPGAFDLLGVEPKVSGILIPVLLVGFFVALRELVITGLWRAVRQQLTTSPVELDAVTRQAI